MASDVARSVLNHIVESLAPLGADFALIGGLALAVWSYPRATRDVDILIEVGENKLATVVDTLLAAGFRPQRVPPVNRVGQHTFVHLLYTPDGEFYDVPFDLLVADSSLEKSALSRSVVREVSGVDRPIRVLGCDDLVLFKLVSGRMIDLADAATLLRENRSELDFDYLGRWIRDLDLMAEYAQIWGEAFPGERMPGV